MSFSSSSSLILISIVLAIAVTAVSVGLFWKGSCICVADFSSKKNSEEILSSSGISYNALILSSEMESVHTIK